MLWKSVMRAPFRNPASLAAFPLAAVDAAGTVGPLGTVDGAVVVSDGRTAGGKVRTSLLVTDGLVVSSVPETTIGSITLAPLGRGIDDDPQIAEAEATGKVVHLAPGTWKRGSLVRITTKTATFDPTLGVCDVSYWLALGDGVADDTAAIRLAAAVGKSLFFPDGLYLVQLADSTELISWVGKSNLSITGKNATIINADFATGKAIRSATYDVGTGLVTITTAAPHGFDGAFAVCVYGLTPLQYNGEFTATKTGNSTFTYTPTFVPATSGTGGHCQAANMVRTYVLLSGCTGIKIAGIKFAGVHADILHDMNGVRRLNGGDDFPSLEEIRAGEVPDSPRESW